MYRNKKWTRVDFQVSLLAGSLVIVSCSLIFALCYHLAYRSMLQSLISRTDSIHAYLENRLQTQSFYALRHRDDEKQTLYRTSIELLQSVRGAAGVRYLYTACRNEAGEFIYLVDGLPSDSPDFRHVGDAIEPEIIPDLERALMNETVLPSSIKETSWGNIFISYYPMHDGDKVIGVLGIEFDAEVQYSTFRMLRLSVPVIIAVFCLLAGVIAFTLFRRVSNPTYRDFANTDMLTDLKNRNAFEIDLRNLDRRAAREQTVLLSADLDDLKTVNDTAGHGAGDEYIRAGCVLLQCALPPDSVLYRIGGDEFAAILHNASAETLASLPDRLQGARASARLSIGWAAFDPAQDSSLFDTLTRADAEMYRNKRERKAAE